MRPYATATVAGYCLLEALVNGLRGVDELLFAADQTQLTQSVGLVERQLFHVRVVHQSQERRHVVSIHLLASQPLLLRPLLL